MRSLYLRIYLTVVAVLALFALVAGWLVDSHLERERARFEEQVRERSATWATMVQGSLPAAGAPREAQAAALEELSARLHVPLALEAGGQRIAASQSYLRRESEAASRELPTLSSDIVLGDGRTLRMLRPGPRIGGGMPGGPEGPIGPIGQGGPGAPAGARGPASQPHPQGPAGMGPFGPGGPMRPGLPWWMPFAPPSSTGLVLLLGVLFAAVALGAWPVVRRLTRRLEDLKQGVEAFGAGQLDRRVSELGHDEVAALGASFNRSAARIETLLRSHQTLLANASHELRSPLARLKMAVSLIDDTPPEGRPALQREIATDIAELDALVEEVLLASRLDAASGLDRSDPVELLGLAAEEAARFGARVQGESLRVAGDERLLRRALRNLLENARRYGGGGEVEVALARRGANAELSVADRGPGVPEASRERIFEPFFRLPGHAEREGGVGLGLALVRQIAQRHGGSVRCEARKGGGSVFVLALPAA